MSSRYGYISTKEELEELAGITVTDEQEAWAQVTKAEAYIDAYVGRQPRHVQSQFTGEVTALSVDKKTISDTASASLLDQTDGYFASCLLEIIGGAGVGQSARIVASDESSKSVTIAEEFGVDPDTTSVFRIYQLSKFPRRQDVIMNRAGTVCYKTIPDAIKRATAAQVAFMIEMGESYFAGDDSEMDGERLLNYNYSRGSNAGQSALIKFVSPQARALLKGYKNSTGVIAVDHP